MKTNTDQFIQQTLELAVDNVLSGQGGPFAALIVKQGKVVSTGTNRVVSKRDPTAHAEIIAIRQACQELNSFQLADCEIYSSCEPCAMCLGAIYWARLQRVYYVNTREQAAAIGFIDELIYQELAKLPAERQIPLLHIPQVNGDCAFEAWRQQVHKIVY